MRNNPLGVFAKPPSDSGLICCLHTNTHTPMFVYFYTILHKVNKSFASQMIQLSFVVAGAHCALKEVGAQVAQCMGNPEKLVSHP